MAGVLGTYTKSFALRDAKIVDITFQLAASTVFREQSNRDAQCPLREVFRTT